MYLHRINLVRKWLEENSLEGLLVLKPENRVYLSGFTGSSGMLLVTSQSCYLFTDFRYLEQAQQEAPHLEIRQWGENPLATLKKLLDTIKVKFLSFEKKYTSFDYYNKLKKALDGKKLNPVDSPVDKLRCVKDNRELKCIQRAVTLADRALAFILPLIKVGMQELEVAAELEYYMRCHGAQRFSFDTIVASGLRSALPHGVASANRITEGNFIVIDFGAVVDGYCSDVTRTFLMGKPDKKQLSIYNLVRNAQERVLEKIRAGIAAAELDYEARKIISMAGYGENFGHSLGHGVGMEVHEEPSLSAKSEVTLEKGMVFTVEPGIYIPNWGGVRIEDMVVVTEEGCRVLTGAPKEFTVL